MSRRLLVADDSVTIQRVVELMFADEDVEVVAVGDGREAVERIEAEPFDIVLADVGMPERDGYEVAAFVRHTPRFSHIPVVLLTGAFEPLDEDRAREAGVDAVLAKPFEPSVAVTRVRELLEGRKPQPAAEETTSASAEPSTLLPRGPLMAPRSADVLHEPPAPSVHRTPAGAPMFSRKEVEPERAEVSDHSLDEYFDRLDASFAELDAGSPSTGMPREARSAADAWRTQDVDIDTFPREATGAAIRAAEQGAHEPQPRPVSVPTVVVEQVRPTESAVQAPAAPAPTTPVPRVHEVAVKPGAPLGDAFAALLAAEQAEARPVPAQTGAVAVPSPDASIDLVEAVTARVLERLTDRLVCDAVSEAIASVIQRLVREEIQREGTRGGR